MTRIEILYMFIFRCISKQIHAITRFLGCSMILKIWNMCFVYCIHIFTMVYTIILSCKICYLRVFWSIVLFVFRILAILTSTKNIHFIQAFFYYAILTVVGFKSGINHIIITWDIQISLRIRITLYIYPHRLLQVFLTRRFGGPAP